MFSSLVPDFNINSFSFPAMYEEENINKANKFVEYYENEHVIYPCYIDSTVLPKYLLNQVKNIEEETGYKVSH